MELIFNDATKLVIQSYEQIGEYLNIKTVSATPEELRKMFEDEKKTQTMKVMEKSRTLETFNGYTQYDGTFIHNGGILEPRMCKKGMSDAERLAKCENDMKVIQENTDKAIAELTIAIATKGA